MEKLDLKIEEKTCPPHEYTYQLMSSGSLEKRMLYCKKCGDIKELSLK